MVWGPNLQQTITITILPNTKLGVGYCDDSGGGVRTYSYDCPSHTKHVKHLLYVWSWSGMSMKWMRGPYHYIIATFELKTETTSSSKAATCRVMVWYGVAPLWPPTTYKACQIPFICMKWIWYEYEVDGRLQSYPTACPQSPVRNHDKILQPSPPLLLVLHPYEH